MDLGALCLSHRFLFRQALTRSPVFWRFACHIGGDATGVDGGKRVHKKRQIKLGVNFIGKSAVKSNESEKLRLRLSDHLIKGTRQIRVILYAKEPSYGAWA